MSLVVITIRDGDDGETKIGSEFEPALSLDEDQPDTHLIALKMLEAVATPDDIVEKR